MKMWMKMELKKKKKKHKILKVHTIYIIFNEIDFTNSNYIILLFNIYCEFELASTSTF